MERGHLTSYFEQELIVFRFRHIEEDIQVCVAADKSNVGRLKRDLTPGVWLLERSRGQLKAEGHTALILVGAESLGHLFKTIVTSDQQ